jgi:hypothetical protein
MKRGLLPVLYTLWPPCELRAASRYFHATLGNDTAGRYRECETRIRGALSCGKGAWGTEGARIVADSEARRLDAIEGKAATYLLGLGIALGLAAGFPALFGDSWQASRGGILMAGACDALGVLHFLVAVHHALETRRVSGIAVPSVDGLLESLSGSEASAEEPALSLLTQARFNEPILNMKANHLSVAETMFRRGLVFLGGAALIGIVGKLIAELHC